MPAFASADQIARAVVAASRLVGADPLALYEPPARKPSPTSRMRWLAFAGLSVVVPESDPRALARCLGIVSPQKAKSNFQLTVANAWWREEWVDEVVGAIVAPEFEDAPPRLPAPASFKYRPPEKPRRTNATLPMGEPSAGRSALDERRRTGDAPSPSPRTDLRRVEARATLSRNGVTLPRLACLEKEV
jgi:hypothetical protein